MGGKAVGDAQGAARRERLAASAQALAVNGVYLIATRLPARSTGRIAAGHKSEIGRIQETES
jgi:hypothetical protein